MSMALAHILEDEDICHHVKKQIKKLKKNKEHINSKSVLTQLCDVVKNTYVITKQMDEEVTLKIDKKRNVDEVKKEIVGILKTIVTTEIDINFLFRFIKNNNELIIRAKRRVQ